MSNIVLAQKNQLITQLDADIQSSIKSIELLAQKDPQKTQGYIQAFLSEVARNPEIQECTPVSLRNAFMFSIQMGLKVGGPRPDAALIVYKKNEKDGSGNWASSKTCQLQPMYSGLNKLMYDTKLVVDVNSQNAFIGEKFRVMGGSNPDIYHELDMGVRTEKSKKFIPNPPPDALETYFLASYTVIQLQTGGKVSAVLDLGYLLRIRQTSKGAFYRDRDKSLTPNLNHPWFTWPEPMAMKSSLIAASKMLPAVDNTDGLFRAVKMDEHQQVGELRPEEIAEDLNLKGIETENPQTMVVSPGIPPTQPESTQDGQTPQESAEDTRALKKRLAAYMTKNGIKSAPTQASIYKAIFGDGQITEDGVADAENLISDTIEAWDRLHIKYESNALAVIKDATDGTCESVVDILVHGQTEKLKEIVG